MNMTFRSLRFILIYVILFLSYKCFVADKFSYMGFEDNLNFTRFIFSVLFVFLSTITFEIVKDSFTRFIIALLFVFVTAPNMVMYSFMGGDIRIPVWSFLCIPITSVILNLFPPIRVPSISSKKTEYLMWALLILCLAPVISAHGIKFNLNAFYFDVYDIRRESRENNTFFSVYGYFWLAKVICPIGIIFALERKKAFMLIIFSMILMYLFMTTGHKSVFLTVLIIMGLYFGKPCYESKVNYFLSACLLLFISVRVVSYFSDFILPESLLVRRLFFIPALLNIFYFDFFDNNYVYYSSSYLSYFMDYPYSATIPQVIGQHFFNSDEMSANNGYLSDGFANFGSVGVFFNVLISSLVIKIFKDYNVPVKYSGLIFVTFYAIQGSAMSTMLFTHGGLLLVLLVPFVLKPKNYDKEVC
ncbi:hypothetical protein ACSTLM_17915 [Vibrio parahaemolyticus]